MMGQEQPDSGEVALGQTVVPMYSEQSRDSLSNDNTVRTISLGRPHLMLHGGRVPDHHCCLQDFAECKHRHDMYGAYQAARLTCWQSCKCGVRS